MWSFWWKGHLTTKPDNFSWIPRIFMVARIASMHSVLLWPHDLVALQVVSYNTWSDSVKIHLLCLPKSFYNSWLCLEKSSPEFPDSRPGGLQSSAILSASCVPATKPPCCPHTQQKPSCYGSSAHPCFLQVFSHLVPVQWGPPSSFTELPSASLLHLPN